MFLDVTWTSVYIRTKGQQLFYIHLVEPLGRILLRRTNVLCFSLSFSENRHELIQQRVFSSELIACTVFFNRNFKKSYIFISVCFNYVFLRELWLSFLGWKGFYSECHFSKYKRYANTDLTISLYARVHNENNTLKILHS